MNRHDSSFYKYEKKLQIDGGGGISNLTANTDIEGEPLFLRNK